MTDTTATYPTTYPYRIIRSERRRTLAIQVKSGQVSVRAPLALPLLVIEQFVADRQAWIARQVRKTLHHRPLYLEPGCAVLITGKPRTLVIEAGTTGLTTLEAQTLHIALSGRVQHRERAALKALDTWLSQQAQAALNPVVEHLAHRLGCAHRLQRIQYRVTRSKWGHCTHQGVIQLNPRLMMAPVGVQHYVVAHEVAHLRHMHHGADFWHCVAQLDPDHQQHRQWLKNHQWCTLDLRIKDQV